MPYMAVGSRQLLFTDSITPALPRDEVREVASYQDNRPEDAVAGTGRVPAEAQPPRTSGEAPVSPGDVGSRVDVSA